METCEQVLVSALSIVNLDCVLNFPSRHLKDFKNFQTKPRILTIDGKWRFVGRIRYWA